MRDAWERQRRYILAEGNQTLAATYFAASPASNMNLSLCCIGTSRVFREHPS